MKLSPHFSAQEFACGPQQAPSGYLHWAQKLCTDYLEPLRAAYGPVRILSGYRTVAHNTEVGGAPASMHMRRSGRRGAAADFTCAKGTPGDWYRFLDGLGVPGLGRYDTHVHADNRSGHARW